MTDYGEITQSLYVQVFWWTMLILVVVLAVLIGLNKFLVRKSLAGEVAAEPGV